MTNSATGPRFRLAPGVALRGGRRPPSAAPDDAPPADAEQPSQPETRTDQPTESTDDRPDGEAADRADGSGSATPGGFRNTSHDRPALAVSLGPEWLLAPLYIRAVADLPVPDHGPDPLPGPLDPPLGHRAAAVPDPAAAGAEWPSWWSAALAYRPGTPAPRVQDLIRDLPALRALWPVLAPAFWAWCAERKAARADGSSDAERAARDVERQTLADFAATNDRAPGRWTVRILEIPVTGSYLSAPESRRIVVSAALRADPAAYAAALTAALPDHF